MRIKTLLFILAIPVINISCNQGEPDWKYLFNGEDLTGWYVIGGDATFKVTDSVIVGTSVMNTPNTFLCTDEVYGDFILEFEFKVHPLLNSGVQIRSMSLPGYMNGRVHGYQVEIDPSDRAWSAGIFDEARRGWLYPVSAPEMESARRSFKSDQWNSVRVEAVGDHIKTWLNGVPVANMFDDKTAEGFIALQVHSIRQPAQEGTTVKWRNIRIVDQNPQRYLTENTAPEVSYLTNKLTDNEIAAGWRLLFDGESGDGWRSACGDEFPQQGWKIENGVLTVLSSEGSSVRGGDIVTEEIFSDFDLRLQVRLTGSVSNSGVKYFIKEYQINDRCSALGPEYQIINDRSPDIDLNPDQTMGSLYDLKAPQNVRNNPIGQWNNVQIVVRGNHVEHWLNGFKVLEYDRESEEFDEWVEASKFKDVEGYGKIDGHILLQEHRDEVSFKSIKIRTF